MIGGVDSLRSLLGCCLTAWLALAGPHLLYVSAAPASNGLMMIEQQQQPLLPQEIIEPYERERIEVDFPDSSAVLPNQWPFRTAISENMPPHEMLPQPGALRQGMNNNYRRADKRGSYVSLCSFKICNMGKRKFVY